MLKAFVGAKERSSAASTLEWLPTKFLVKYWKVSSTAFWEKEATQKIHLFCILKQIRFAPCKVNRKCILLEQNLQCSPRGVDFPGVPVIFGPSEPFRTNCHRPARWVQPCVFQLCDSADTLHPWDQNWWKPHSLKHWNARISSISIALWLPEEEPTGKLDRGLWPSNIEKMNTSPLFKVTEDPPGHHTVKASWEGF